MSGAKATDGSSNVADPQAGARGTIYVTLARLFDEPDEDLHEALNDGSLATDLEHLASLAEVDIDVPSLVTDDDYDLLCARFNDIFAVGYPDPPVARYESAYAPEGKWEDINLDLARGYDFFGVEIDKEQREHHDHLQLELEFAGYLARLAASTDDESVRKARRDFLDRHLVGFMSDVATAMADEVETGVFDDVVEFATAFVTADLVDLEDRLGEEVVDP